MKQKLKITLMYNDNSLDTFIVDEQNCFINDLFLEFFLESGKTLRVPLISLKKQIIEEIGEN